MPLRVHCPNGCLIRMPTSRAGKIVRCPKCKTVIELRMVSTTEDKSGKPIPIHAVRVDAASQPESVLDSSQFEVDQDSQALSDISDAIDAAAAGLAPAPSKTLSIGPKKNSSRLGIPSEFTPFGFQKSKAEHKAKLKRILAIPEVPAELQQPRVQSGTGDPNRKNVGPQAPVLFDGLGLNEITVESVHWEDRIKSSNADRVVLSRLFAISLCVMAVINMIPALAYWYDWYREVEPTQLPRWIYLQFFVAAIYGVYTVFLYQVPDWSAVRAVSVAMLVIAFVFGMISTGLLLGGGQGAVAVFLGVSHVVVQRAVIWCVIMLCLATLMSYLGGRESANWQRAEQLSDEINLGKQKIL